MRGFVAVAGILAMLETAAGADHPILGRKTLVSDPTGRELQRSVVILGKESGTDLGSFNDPTGAGATLTITIVRTSGSSMSEVFALDAIGWTRTGSGFKYTGPTGGDGDPVKSVALKRTPGGVAVLKVIVKGRVGTQNVTIIPPNFGGTAYPALDIGADRYCVVMADGGGLGTEVADGPTLWKLLKATTQPTDCVF